jgi:tetratricopeptide (TPR) repeat protein
LLYTTKKDNFDKKYFELAKSYLDQANKIDPSDFMPYLLNGIIFEYDNDYSSALEYF